MRWLNDRIEALAFEVLPAPLLARLIRRRCMRRHQHAHRHDSGVSPRG